MARDEQKDAWLQRVEDLINILEGSSIGELELVEDDTEIIIRRQTNIVMVSTPAQPVAVPHPGVHFTPGFATPVAPSRPLKEDRSIAIIAPLTGVYYGSPSPSSCVGCVWGVGVQAGQVVALVEAMKVFNEIQSEISGRVSMLVATNGNVVQKGDVLLRIEPA